MEDILIDLNREFYKDLAHKGLRMDGRSTDQHREIWLRTGVITTANGSARLRLGETDVLTCIRYNREKILDKKNNDISVAVTIRFQSGISNNKDWPFNQAHLNDLAYSLKGVLSNSGFMDISGLQGPAVDEMLVFNVDIIILDHNGNIPDAVGLSALAALGNASLTEDDGVFGYTKNKINLMGMPIPFSFAKIGDLMILDPDMKEELTAGGIVTFWLDPGRMMHAVNKFGKGRYSRDFFLNALNIAADKIPEIYALFP